MWMAMLITGSSVQGMWRGQMIVTMKSRSGTFVVALQPSYLNKNDSEY